MARSPARLARRQARVAPRGFGIGYGAPAARHIHRADVRRHRAVPLARLEAERRLPRRRGLRHRPLSPVRHRLGPADGRRLLDGHRPRGHRLRAAARRRQSHARAPRDVGLAGARVHGGRAGGGAPDESPLRLRAERDRPPVLPRALRRAEGAGRPRRPDDHGAGARPPRGAHHADGRPDLEPARRGPAAARRRRPRVPGRERGRSRHAARRRRGARPRPRRAGPAAHASHSSSRTPTWPARATRAWRSWRRPRRRRWRPSCSEGA